MLGNIFQWILNLFSQKKSSDGLGISLESSPSQPNLSDKGSSTTLQKESLKNRINKGEFIQCFQTNQVTVAQYYPSLLDSMDKYNINTYQRVIMFFATIGHESMSMRYTSELWGPTDAQRRYSGREDLGNTFPEAIQAAKAHNKDVGFFYRGHGLIQITGYYNHKKCGEALGLDLVNEPSLISQPQWAGESACWWWANNGCNKLADSGDFKAVTRRVNGGYNGIKDREARLSIVKGVLTPW